MNISDVSITAGSIAPPAVAAPAPPPVIAAGYQLPPNSFLGSCKWYDSTKKYGFIRPLGGGDDIFVHRTDLNPTLCREEPFLVTGEYVQFELGPATGRYPKAKAVNVTGLWGGPLMCDHGRVRFQSYFRGDPSAAASARQSEQPTAETETTAEDGSADP